MARRRLRAKKNMPKSEGDAQAVEKHNGTLVDFHKFPELPIELQLVIIEEALQEDQKGRPARVILFDHHTYRISPLVEQSRDLSPMLFVNTLFRKAALSIYVMLDVIEVGVPYLGEYGDEMDYFNENDDLEYNLDIAKQIDNEGEGDCEAYEGPKGRVYIRPGTDIFLTGLVPRQIANTEIFSSLLDAGPDEAWSAPVCHVTERLPLAACAQISTMRDLVWDPGCPNCGENHPIHCRECFLEGRGRHLADPGYDAAVYPGVKEFGIYVMGGDHIPETLMYLLAITQHATKMFFVEMGENYVVGFLVPA
ncbi:hypothetical protein N0V93_000267 [Gnomoniopsis smithogilvyi]|uniref:2EXR domain-containing protein n=1 Tax=Gnomoniopsis smithogilvyi TaxID=1191159 RepID=A0A9W9D1K7_9PEZI|nr:hypothetical protein N0V93_000267 [Gnomoniopsis smithogilvyi]